MDPKVLKKLTRSAYVSLSHWVSLKETEFLKMTVRDSVANLEKDSPPDSPIDWYDELAMTIQENLVNEHWYHPRLTGAYLRRLNGKAWSEVIKVDFATYVRPKRRP